MDGRGLPYKEYNRDDPLEGTGDEAAYDLQAVAHLSTDAGRAELDAHMIALYTGHHDHDDKVTLCDSTPS